MSTFIGREHVEAIACCLVREYLFRKSQEIQGLQDVLHSLEERFPRSPQCFQHRDQLIRAVSLEKAAKDNKIAALSYRSLIEILVADRLEKRRLKTLIRSDKDIRQLENEKIVTTKGSSEKTSVLNIGVTKGLLNLDDTSHILRSPSPEKDRVSPVGIPAKATTSILASHNESRPLLDRRSMLRRDGTVFYKSPPLDKTQNGLSSSDEDISQYKDQEKERERERVRARPQSARIRYNSQDNQTVTKAPTVSRDGEVDLERRKSAWSHLTRTTNPQVAASASSSSSSGGSAPTNVNPMAPLAPPVAVTAPFNLHDSVASVAGVGNVTRVNQTSTASALLERTDNILKKKAGQRPPSRGEDVTLEDLTGQHDDHGPMRTESSRTFAHRKITVSENEQLQKLLFGDSSRSFGDEWLRQGLEFSREDSRVAYGLRQSKGGPCGVLAVTQAYIFKHLLWPEGKSEGGDMSLRLRVTESSRRGALIRAIHEILVQAGSPDGLDALKTQSGGPFKYVLGRVAGTSQRTAFTSLTIYNLPTTEQLLGFLTQHQEEVLRDGVVQLLISILLCRGVDNIRKDMDSPDHSLIGRHNHTTQEVVNLMLTGRAVSNLFDDRLDVEGTILKGIQQRSTCGLLSLVEAYGIIEVGSHLKNPKFPIWVLISENHYFVLFATSVTVLDSRSPFDLLVYDGLANADTATVVKVDPSRSRDDAVDESSKNPVELCVRTKWKRAVVEVIED